MGAEQDIGLGADSFTDSGNHALRKIESFERGLMTVEHGIWPCGVELHCGEPTADFEGCSFCCRRRVAIDVGGVSRFGVQIGIRTKRIVHPATKQLVRGFADFLADDVPARHLERTHTSHE